MKFGAPGPVPWDMVVFFTITTVGFGYSVKRIMNPIYAPSSAHFRSYETSAETPSATLDLGCVEQKIREAVTAEDGVIRLRGKICKLTPDQLKEFGNLRVTNISTGSEGTVIFQGYDNSFVTDPLVLRRGKNLIQVEWHASKSSRRTYVAEVLQR